MPVRSRTGCRQALASIIGMLLSARFTANRPIQLNMMAAITSFTLK